MELRPGGYYWSEELLWMHGLDPACKPPGVQEYLRPSRTGIIGVGRFHRRALPVRRDVSSF
jgi:hypothetical protein